MRYRNLGWIAVSVVALLGLTGCPSLVVDITPQEAIDAGAQWQVDGGEYQNSGAAIATLEPGSHVVSFRPIEGWIENEDVIVEIIAEQTARVTATYTQIVATAGSLTVMIEPQEARMAGVQWRVDDGGLLNSGAVIENLALGDHLVSFTDAPGWVTPPPQTVTVVAGQLTSAMATYQPVAAPGALTVTIEPEGAVLTGARWKVNGGDFQDSGATLSNLEAGSYTVSFSPTINGWIAPDDMVVDIVSGETTAITATYTHAIGTGALNVMIEPLNARQAGAQWRVDGGPWQDSSFTVFQLATGDHTVSFSVIEGWTQPVDLIVSVEADQTAMAVGTYTQGGLNTSHAGRFTTYEGSKTCNGCHLDMAQQVHDSVHYQWYGSAPDVVNIEAGGKITGINDFCTYARISWLSNLTNVDGQIVDGGCAQCHVGMGLKPLADATTEQVENIDCLICHADSYKRKVVQVDGVFRFVTAPERMTVPELQAITDIGRPSNSACVNCHAYAGGGNNNKRGDIEEAHRYPQSRDFDVHMASREVGGVGLQCVDCHISTAHHIAGRGVDLTPTDLDAKVACTNCHSSAPHEEYELDMHTGRVNCTVCHIPVFAKVTTTDMLRDYSAPADLDEVKRLYEPHIEREGMVVPEYRFWNGLSEVYPFGTEAMLNDRGRVQMAGPLGDVTDRNAQLNAFKHHEGVMPYDIDTGFIAPLKMGILFQTGNVDRAIKQGAAEVGWPMASGYDFVPVERYMGIFHEVSPKEDALRCNDCHFGGSRVDFEALGYTPKTERNGQPICASCHEDQSDEWNASVLFQKVHEKHVKDKRINCIECHIFSTPL